jgi:hypothetical protein
MLLIVSGSILKYLLLPFLTSETIHVQKESCVDVIHIFKVLKPGGKFATYEWAMTDVYDSQNATHKVLKEGIERGNVCGNLIYIHLILCLGFTRFRINSYRCPGFEGCRL